MKYYNFLILLCLGHSASIYGQQTVHPDNTIIQGNQCLGIDCTTSESFGFDILRFKENVLRIHFDDASTGSSPKNDWRITVNDVSIGGDEYFAIEDATADRQVFRLEAGAPLNALTVAPNGNLGLGTHDAQQDIHIVSSANPAIRFEQDTSGSNASQVWELSGNEEYFSIKDQSASEAVPFRIAHTAEENTLVVDSLGHVGIGTVNPGYELQVAGDIDISGELTCASDQRLKKDIKPLRSALDKIGKLAPVTYHFRHDEFPEMNLATSIQMGLIAQEVEMVLPELVKENTVVKDLNGEENAIKSVNYLQLIPLLIAGIQEQEKRIELQAKRIEILETELNEFKEMETSPAVNSADQTHLTNF
ncbi:MAG: tail fiber domain-containing protein [Saprospiraceae bacterium]|nr:tail fiber domain-containing protein [Saprospiraceae bacterium]